jgi:hypothetical protein
LIEAAQVSDYGSGAEVKRVTPKWMPVKEDRKGPRIALGLRPNVRDAWTEGVDEFAPIGLVQALVEDAALNAEPMRPLNFCDWTHSVRDRLRVVAKEAFV